MPRHWQLITLIYNRETGATGRPDWYDHAVKLVGKENVFVTLGRYDGALLFKTSQFPDFDKAAHAAMEIQKFPGVKRVETLVAAVHADHDDDTRVVLK